MPEETKQKTKIHTVYKVDDKRVPSVTTILGVLGKPALIHWAWQCGVDGLDYRNVRDEAADIGTLAHYLIMCHLKNEKPNTSEYSQENIGLAENSFLSYLNWEKQHTLVPLMVETPLTHGKYKFGGTIDCFAILDGETALIDFKTGKAIYSDMFYQLAAYVALIEADQHEVKTSRILRIGRTEDEGFDEVVRDALPQEWQLFLHCLGVYDLQKEIKRR
ncbi:hypothetical protein LCGC14_0386300 [marine sediment metagenome]|uniref:Uncharacterized protein n=1 Tax=marine sediment metagenome TaxID=412755 RepID=A0A0F9VN33_9ZZZZ